MKNKFQDYPLLKISRKQKSVPLFYPHIPKNAKKIMSKILSTRWIGQGPLVDKFEKVFSKKFCNKHSTIAVGSGTDALHLAYLLSDLKEDDEVICPVFTCTATNIPLLYIRSKIKFADIDPDTFNVSLDSIKKLITKKTKAIVFVNYGGLLCDLDGLNKLVKNKSICDYADFTIFSFQAIKHITSGDGGALCIRDKKLVNKAKRIRWFGINRERKQNGTWENDIKEIGYKYQMTDLGAGLLLESIKEFKKIRKIRNEIYKTYLKYIKFDKKISCLKNKDKKASPVIWLFTIISPYKNIIQKELRKYKIETNQVHFRNDKYSIFKSFSKKSKFRNMDKLEEQYLVLPVHTKMSAKDAKNISFKINEILRKNKNI